MKKRTKKSGNGLVDLKVQLTVLKREQLKKINEKERETIKLAKIRAKKEREELEIRYHKKVEAIRSKIFGKKMSELKGMASQERRKLQSSKNFVRKTVRASNKLKRK